MAQLSTNASTIHYLAYESHSLCTTDEKRLKSFAKKIENQSYTIIELVEKRKQERNKFYFV